jgi:cysteine desulfurase
MGFAAAVGLLDPAEPARLAALRARLEAQVLDACPATRIAGDGASRAPHIVSLVTPGRPADLQVIRMDLDGIAVSAGAACSSGKVAASHVLAAMGMGADAACAIRVSLGWTTNEVDIDRFARSFARMHGASSNISDRQPSPLPNASPVAT